MIIQFSIREKINIDLSNISIYFLIKCFFLKNCEKTIHFCQNLHLAILETMFSTSSRGQIICPTTYFNLFLAPPL